MCVSILAGCKVGPDYHPPKNDIPNAWHEVKPMTATAEAKPEEQKPAELDKKALAELEWWKQFNDPVLDAIIEKGLQQNYDLKIAKARIAQARAQLSQARSALLPDVDIIATGEREANEIAFGSTTIPKPFNIFQTGFDATWELDVFGGNRRIMEAVGALFGASKADMAEARVSVLAEIARTYINIRQYQAQVAAAQDTVHEEEDNLKIRQELFHAGSTSESDAIAARTSSMQAKSQLLNYQSLLAASEYNLDLLLGENPGASHELVAEVKPVPVADKEIVLAAPADVIANRPDIRAAERRLAADNAKIGAQTAKLFPEISLGGFFGFFSPKADNLLNAQSKAWNVNGGLNWPILNYNEINAGIHLAKAQRQEALEIYKKSVTAALVDVETSLSNYNKQEETRTLADKTVAETQHALDIANMRYKSGLDALTEVLGVQKTFYASKMQAAAVTAGSAQDFIAVYKSLGGGWQPQKKTDQQAPAATPAPTAATTPTPTAVVKPVEAAPVAPPETPNAAPVAEHPAPEQPKELLPTSSETSFAPPEQPAESPKDTQKAYPAFMKR